MAGCSMPRASPLSKRGHDGFTSGSFWMAIQPTGMLRCPCPVKSTVAVVSFAERLAFTALLSTGFCALFRQFAFQPDGSESIHFTFCRDQFDDGRPGASHDNAVVAEDRSYRVNMRPSCARAGARDIAEAVVLASCSGQRDRNVPASTLKHTAPDPSPE